MTLYDDLTPAPDAPAVDWPAAEEAFDWFRALSDCPQDPVHHAEGDVGVHTRMVVEALLGGGAWSATDAAARRMLFWAALLHDVAKPACTRTDADGRVRSPGHSRRGSIMARRILRHLAAPFAERETICHLISHHQAPFFLIERQDARRQAHRISWRTRCDLLAVLAEADARGRRCADPERLLDNIALFAELCREEDCLGQPRPFASDHSRFLYFRSETRDAAYAAYDDWPGAVTLLSGLPCSGKSTWLEAAAPTGSEIVSLDDIRVELGVDPAGEQGKVIATARDRARVALRARRPLIWNATNVGPKTRTPIIDLAADYSAKVTIRYFETAAEEADRRNRRRERPVPEGAMARMLDHWEPPDPTECHNLAVQFT